MRKYLYFIVDGCIAGAHPDDKADAEGKESIFVYAEDAERAWELERRHAAGTLGLASVTVGGRTVMALQETDHG